MPVEPSFSEYYARYVDAAVVALASTKELLPQLESAASALTSALTAGGTVYFLGNGGSASDAQHLAAELVGRFAFNREPLRAVCLNTDTSVLTALANDYGYDDAFARQVRALARPGDAIVLISTSGESLSVLAAARAGATIGAVTIALTGPATSSLARLADIVLAVGQHDTCHIQESHIAIGQALCGYVERTFFDGSR